MIHLLRMGAAAMQGALMRREPGPDPQPFDPSQVPGLEAWYRGDSYAGGVAMDLSGNGRDATAVDTVNTVVSRGQPAFEFSGEGRLVAEFGETIPQPITFYLVTMRPSVSTVNHTLAASSGATGPRVYSVSTGYRVGMGTVLTFGSPQANQVAAICGVADGVSSLAFADDFAVPGATGDMGAGNLIGVTIGSNVDGSNALEGLVWDVLLYSGAHDAETRAKVAGYFNARYGLNITT